MACICWERLQWKCSVFLCGLAATVHQVKAGNCDNDKNGQGDRQNYNCWYELWYFWFIIVLFFVMVTAVILFCCKQQVKRAAGRRGRRRTPVMTMPTAPPHYEAEGCQPPPYHIAVSTARDSVQTPPPPHQNALMLPGYVLDAQERHAYDNMSMVSTISEGVFSNPPPYSPPRSAMSSAGLNSG